MGTGKRADAAKRVTGSRTARGAAVTKHVVATRAAGKRGAAADVTEAVQVAGGTGRTEASAAVLKPSGCREYLRREAARAFPAVVDGFLEQAKAGSCQHLRFLTEMFEQTRPTVKMKAEKGVAEVLVEEWLR